MSAPLLHNNWHCQCTMALSRIALHSLSAASCAFVKMVAVWIKSSSPSSGPSATEIVSYIFHDPERCLSKLNLGDLY